MFSGFSLLTKLKLSSSENTQYNHEYMCVFFLDIKLSMVFDLFVALYCSCQSRCLEKMWAVKLLKPDRITCFLTIPQRHVHYLLMTLSSLNSPEILGKKKSHSSLLWIFSVDILLMGIYIFKFQSCLVHKI